MRTGDVTGERFDALMRRLVLEPLGLRGGYNVADLATLYHKRTVDTEVWDLQGPRIAQVDDYRAGPSAPLSGLGRYVPGTNATPFSPTGGLRTGTRNLGVLMLMLMLMNNGMHAGRPFLGASTLATRFARAWTFDGRNGDTLHGLYRAWSVPPRNPDQSSALARCEEKRRSSWRRSSTHDWRLCPGAVNSLAAWQASP